MNSALPTPLQASGIRPISDERLVLRPVDDDIALGCECANPALQIERWGQEAPVISGQSY